MIELIMNVPVIVKVMVSLAMILVLNRITKSLMVAAAVGAVTLGAWSGHSALDILSIAWGRFSSASILMLMVVVFEVITLSRQMSEAGVMKELVAVVQSRVPKRASIAVLPAMIGLLPMPGGAIFSAPLVDDVDSDKSIDPLLKTRINYWFRHVWEYWWPLYPAVLLTLALTKLEPWQLMLLHLPLTVASLVVGHFFLLRKVKRSGDDEKAKSPHRYKDVLELVSPILVVIGVYAAIRLLVPVITRANRYFPMAIGIVCAIGLMQRLRPLNRAQWLRVVFSKKSFVLVALVIVVMIYGGFIQADLPDGTPLVKRMKEELDGVGVPLIAVMMILPFVSGLATGLGVGFVGASFPIIMNLIGENPTMAVLLPATVLSFGFGYIGMMLSPVHICLIVTNEHFRTRLSDSIFRLAVPAAVVLVIVVLYYFVVRWFCGVAGLG